MNNLAGLVMHNHGRAGRGKAALPQLTCDPVAVGTSRLGIRQMRPKWIVMPAMERIEDKMVTRHDGGFQHIHNYFYTASRLANIDPKQIWNRPEGPGTKRSRAVKA